MTKLQTIVLAVAAFLFLGMYFGTSTKPPSQKEVEKNRSLVIESTDINTMLMEAKPKLSAQQSSYILALESQIQEITEDSLRIPLLKDLSGKWYDYGRADIAGFYAEQVAKQNEEEEAWSITGTTYLIGARQAQEDKLKDFCKSRAISAFENALSLNPSNSAHKVNLATVYAEFPPQDNPMKGILMLIEMNKANPDDVPVLVSLGRFGIQTGQFDKAIERLTRAVNLVPEHKRANCLLANALNKSGKTADASIYQKKCEQLQQL